MRETAEHPADGAPAAIQTLVDHRTHVVENYASAAQRHYLAVVSTAMHDLPAQQRTLAPLLNRSTLPFEPAQFEARMPIPIRTTLAELRRSYVELGRVQSQIEERESQTNQIYDVSADLHVMDAILTSLGMATIVQELAQASQRTGRDIAHLTADDMESLRWFRRDKTFRFATDAASKRWLPRSKIDVFAEPSDALANLPKYGRALRYEALDSALFISWQGEGHNPEETEAWRSVNTSRERDMGALAKSVDSATQATDMFDGAVAEARRSRASRFAEIIGNQRVSIARDRLVRQHTQQQLFRIPKCDGDVQLVVDAALKFLSATLAGAARELRTSPHHRDRQLLARFVRTSPYSVDMHASGQGEEAQWQMSAEELRAAQTDLWTGTKTKELRPGDEDFPGRERKLEEGLKKAGEVLLTATLVQDLLTTSRALGVGLTDDAVPQSSLAFTILRHQVGLVISVDQFVKQLDSALPVLESAYVRKAFDARSPEFDLGPADLWSQLGVQLVAAGETAKNDFQAELAGGIQLNVPRAA